MESPEVFESPDLAGVIVGTTAISDVRGEEGVLSYRGIAIEELTDKPFLAVAFLVIFGRWPSADESQRLAQFMSHQGQLSGHELSQLRQLPVDLHPMLMLQGMVPLLHLPTQETLGLGLDAEQGLAVAARMAALIAAYFRLQRGEQPIADAPEEDFHANFLHAVHGTTPSADAVTILNTTQILQMEHSFNAGTFAGRVCASTLAPIQSSISASIGTLYGRLHGGADQAALEMAAAIGAPESATEYVAQCLAEKTKIMGMGHREYRTVDPRAKILKPMAQALCRDPDSKQLLDTLVAVEDACREAFAVRGKEIWANVEFYKGAVFHSLGLPSHYFTALFAMARVYGYIAHYVEFSRDSRLIRPRARYRADATRSAA
jgi:citrate synthase